MAALLLCTDPLDPTRPKYYAKEALDIYLKNGSDIFSASKRKRFLSKLGLVSELYNADVFEAILYKYFGNAKLSELIKPAIFTAYNIELRKNHIFRQQKAISHGDIRDFYLRDICRSTAAAPTYFSVAEVFSLAGTRYTLVDGGLFAHNPSICALLELLKTYGTFKIDDVHILSLGTGVTKKSYNYEDFRKKWSIYLGSALVDIMASSSSKSNDYFLKQLFKSIKKECNYVRIEPTNLSSISTQLDAASPGNIKKIVSLADKPISENEHKIDHIVDKLIKDSEQRKDKSVWKSLISKS